jgi:hypothetical protein
MLFMNGLEFSCFANFLFGFSKQEKSNIFCWEIKSTRRRECEKHGTKDLEYFVELMSKNSISGIMITSEFFSATSL